MKRSLALLLAWTAAVSAPGDLPIRGFDSAAAASERSLEIKARAVPEPERMRSYMERMTKDAHIAGSPQSKAVAEYAVGLMKEWGLEAEIEEFDALLPYPTSRTLEMLAPGKFRAKLHEPAIPEDRASRDPKQIPTYNAYSATGNVTAPLVYVNYGVPEDYEQLRKLGVEVSGKIVIARYGKSWRGTKAKVAQEHGAAGCLIYSDPRDDGYFQGDVYPKGPFRPPQGVQRGSVMDMPVYVGDPLSPGWASEKGTRRLSRGEAGTLMKIPVLPISYGDAQPLLEKLTGPVAPEAWRGALPITYHLGPGPANVHLQVDFDWTSKPVYDVVATIRGEEAPDQWVIYGNHHDAWDNGASDPISGAVAVLETARTLAKLKADGWRPKRTVKLALWDAEEFGLIGSTEWAEKHAAELTAGGVVYFNSDVNGTGWLTASGSPVLEHFFGEVMRDVRQPGSEKSLLEHRPDHEGKPAPYKMGPAGAGSDYVAFLHHTGVASVNSGFSGASEGGVYHSAYDSFEWYTKFSDRDFAHGKALAQVMTTAILRMADAALLPFEFGAVARSIEEWMKDLPKVDAVELHTALARLKSASERYETAYAAAKPFGDARAAIAVNQAILRTERALLSEAGLPGRPWYKHQLMAPGRYTGYSAKTLPAIRDSDDPQAGVRLVAAALQNYTSSIERATDLLGP